MEESQQQTPNSNPSYWTSIAVAGLLFGIISFALTLVYNYSVINSEPTGSAFSPNQLISTFACLLGALGGCWLRGITQENMMYPLSWGKAH